ncbi:hypothetical protein GCM10011507_17480 [Edaphobacter acidisoli]|uniref:Uncharacterized protein n=1 Tax=Edaphobacter acidisoli TaxID=2040573 RepID=A0A916RRB9_9BACT|nr:rhamnogalacturonan acetylesterase [Edaphobacter acidisoli]GGA66467.1 hypothetical protein GCM10011507_17480 [Edaphobacter acidisoli]
MPSVQLCFGVILATAATFSSTSYGQAVAIHPEKPLPSVVAGIPVNYDQAKVGTYTLPDPLVLQNGKPVRDAKTWFTKRRPEIVKFYEEDQYGRSPRRPKDMTFDVFDKGTPAFDGKAIRKQVTIYFSKDKNGPKMDLLVYVPAASAAAHKSVPLLLNISFTANSNTVDDPGVKPGEVWDLKLHKLVPAIKGRGFGHLNVPMLLNAGFGVATFYYGDVDPDDPQGLPYGVRALYMKSEQTERAPDAWGSIAAWAWGMSRAMDYLETDKDVDAKRVAITGISRLGKTVMWAGAHDTRFAMVLASCSGEGGAALSRRNYGETIAHLTAPTRYPYQFARNYAKYAQHVDQLPVDANMLVSLIAPRPLLLQTGDKDYWSDPKGEFLAEVAAGPVYKLLGKDGLDTDQWPPAGVPILHDLGYYMHDGGHGMVPSDWKIYLEFMKMHLKPEPIAETSPALTAVISTDPPLSERLHAQEVRLHLPVPANLKLPTLWLVGDSTVRNGHGDGAGGQWGWGDPLSSFFDPSKINVVNRAIGGLSSRNFITEGHWAEDLAMMKPGDVVLIQFGHNDGGPLDDPARARGSIPGIGDETKDVDNPVLKIHETVHTYGWYLRKYVEDARARGVTPIICTLIPRKIWRDGKIVRNDDTYAGWAREVATQEHVGLIDLNKRIADRYDAMGEAAVEPLFADPHTHTSLIGAKLNAEVVVEGLKALPNDPVAGDFSANGDAVSLAR